MTKLVTKEDYEKDLKLRFAYFYLRTNGTYDWPNSAEGDMLRMTWKMLNLSEEEKKTTAQEKVWNRLADLRKFSNAHVPSILDKICEEEDISFNDYLAYHRARRLKEEEAE